MKIGKRGLIAAALGALAAASMVTVSVRAQDDEPVDGPGKSVLIDTCTACHASGVITAERHSTDEWSDIVTRMMGLGAMVSDDQYKSIVTYLSTYYGKQPAPAATAAPAH